MIKLSRNGKLIEVEAHSIDWYTLYHVVIVRKSGRRVILHGTRDFRNAIAVAAFYSRRSAVSS